MVKHQGRLKNLYDMSEKVRIAMLGQDWETRMKLKEVLERVNLEIKKETGIIR